MRFFRGLYEDLTNLYEVFRMFVHGVLGGFGKLFKDLWRGEVGLRWDIPGIRAEPLNEGSVPSAFGTFHTLTKARLWATLQSACGCTTTVEA